MLYSFTPTAVASATPNRIFTSRLRNDGKGIGDGEDDEEFDANTALWLAVLLVFGGAVAMAFFSDLAVGYAVEISTRLGIPEAVIGATVIAAGGSLPEVSSCIAAARIKRPNLILGNIAGSQIFNILGILGLSGMISSFTYKSYLWVDIGILIVMTLILLLCMNRPGPRKFKGPLLLASYGAYAAYLIIIAL